MDIKIKSEPIDIELAIKEERELIIEDEWLPSKTTENEYYQEFGEECNQNNCPETVVKSEHFTIEYLDEISDDHGDSEDDYAESDYTSVRNDSDEEDYYLDEEGPKKTKNKASASFRVELTSWFAFNYLTRECPICNEKFANSNELRRHIKLYHKDSIDASESNYYVREGNCVVCKICNKEFFQRSFLFMSQFSRYIHSASHSEDGKKLRVFICKICNFSIVRRFRISKHILEKHPEVVEEFKTLHYMSNLKCPICFKTYAKNRHLWYHFMDKHPDECRSKLIYNCYLCEHEEFSEEEQFFLHLMEKHELNSWKILNYRQVFSDKDYFACKKCNSLFFQNDKSKLLRHFLKHESNFCWSCKFCCNKFNFKTSHVSHMCLQMMEYYEKHCKKVIAEKISKNPMIIKNLQEFEDHLAHVCPFCNKEFDKMLKWQQHLKADHEIDTLKGLQMKVTNDNNKLCCIICHTVVANSPEELHAHRFQHLPYKPYKCLSCSRPLNSFKIAVNHVLKQCEDNVDVLSNLKMQCSMCNYQKITDFKHYEDKHNFFEEFFIMHSDNSMTCKICRKKYIHHKKNSCFLHLQHHFDEKTFKCKLCTKSFPNLQRISFHLLHVHNAKSFSEQPSEENVEKNQCFLDKDDEIADVSKLPQLGKSSTKSHVLNEFNEFISYACPECNVGMPTQQMWHIHIRTEHNFFDESNLYIKDADGVPKCPSCKMTVNISITQQQKHKLTHMPYRSFICNLCYTRCNSLGVLYGHFRRQHFAEGTFKCYICAEVLQTEYKRTLHIKEVHPRDEWPSTMCVICYKLLARKINLRQHLITHDVYRHKYTCDICRISIITYRDFNAHIERHKMRGEFKNKVCDDIALQSSSKSCQPSGIVIPESELQHKKKSKYTRRPKTDAKQHRKKRKYTKRSKIDAK